MTAPLVLLLFGDARWHGARHWVSWLGWQVVVRWGGSNKLREGASE